MEASGACEDLSAAIVSAGRPSARSSAADIVHRTSGSSCRSNRSAREQSQCASTPEAPECAAVDAPAVSSSRSGVDGARAPLPSAAGPSALRSLTHARATSSACSRLAPSTSSPAPPPPPSPPPDPSPRASHSRENGAGVARRYRIATGLACGKSSSSIPRAAHARSCITAALRGSLTDASAPGSPPFRCFFRDFPSSAVLLPDDDAAARLDASRASNACDSACSATGLRHPPVGTAYSGSRSKLPAAASMASSDAPLRTRHRLAPPAPPPGTSVKDWPHWGEDSGASGQRSAMRSKPRRRTSFRSMLT